MTSFPISCSLVAFGVSSCSCVGAPFTTGPAASAEFFNASSVRFLPSALASAYAFFARGQKPTSTIAPLTTSSESGLISALKSGTAADGLSLLNS